MKLMNGMYWREYDRTFHLLTRGFIFIGGMIITSIPHIVRMEVSGVIIVFGILKRF